MIKQTLIIAIILGIAFSISSCASGQKCNGQKKTRTSMGYM